MHLGWGSEVVEEGMGMDGMIVKGMGMDGIIVEGGEEVESLAIEESLMSGLRIIHS